MLELNDQWWECMAAEGFSQFLDPGSLLAEIGRWGHEATAIEDPIEREQALEAALTYDIAATTASYLCDEQLRYDDRRLEIIYEYEVEFFDGATERINDLASRTR